MTNGRKILVVVLRVLGWVFTLTSQLTNPAILGKAEKPVCTWTVLGGS